MKWETQCFHDRNLFTVRVLHNTVTQPKSYLWLWLPVGEFLRQKLTQKEVKIKVKYLLVLKIERYGICVERIAYL